MKILVYGAGPLGTLYAAKLQEAGNDVSILARGSRLNQIKEHGLVIRYYQENITQTTTVNIVEALNPQDNYDLVVVLMRKNQVDAILPALSAAKNVKHVLFMVSNPSGYDEWLAAVGESRLMIGFAGAGGCFDGHTVICSIMPKIMQPTTFGLPGGTINAKLKKVSSTFRKAGFPTDITENIDAWQKTHQACIGPIAHAVYMAGGNTKVLSQRKEIADLMIEGIREGLDVLNALDIPITPSKLSFWRFTPQIILTTIFRAITRTKAFEVLIVTHGMKSKDEQMQLAQEFNLLAKRAGIDTPSLRKLMEANTFRLESKQGEVTSSAPEQATPELSNS